MASGVPSDPQLLWLSAWLRRYLGGASHAPAVCGCPAWTACFLFKLIKPAGCWVPGTGRRAAFRGLGPRS